MKRLFFPIALIAIMFASCKKYETSEALDLSTLPTVTLTGTVYAELDETRAGYETAPAGTMIWVSVPYKSYSTTTVDSGKWISETTLNSAGQFSINVPVVPKGVSATISFADFTYEVTKLNSLGQQRQQMEYFSRAAIPAISLSNGKTEYIMEPLYYTSNSINPRDTNIFTSSSTVTISGKMEYRDSISGTTLKSVPYGTTLTATITLTNSDNKQYKEIQTVTVNYAGSYSISVPMVERGTASVKLEGEGFWEYTTLYPSTERAIYRYTLNQTIPVYNFQNQIGKDFLYTAQNKVSDIQ
ncbi:MAG: hypothetical protein LBI60_01000 [Bacteroidales bacterium]|jgi:hypothetical protein|nr:hypothetical protein [Bacteroidales bacterium]